MKLPFRVSGSALLWLLDKGLGLAIGISDLLSRPKPKKKLDDLVQPTVDRHAPTVVLKRPLPPRPPPR